MCLKLYKVTGVQEPAQKASFSFATRTLKKGLLHKGLYALHSSISSSISVMEHPGTYRTRLLGSAPDTTCEARLISSGEVRLYEAFPFSELRDGSVESC